MTGTVVRQEEYKGLVLKAFWYKPTDPEAPLVYGYLAEEGDSLTEGLGFKNSVEAMKAARKAADGMLDIKIPAKGKYSVKP